MICILKFNINSLRAAHHQIGTIMKKMIFFRYLQKKLLSALRYHPILGNERAREPEKHAQLPARLPRR